MDKVKFLRVIRINGIITGVTDMKKTFIQLMQDHTEHTMNAVKVLRELESIPNYQDIRAVILSSDYFTPQSEQLTKLLNERDEPMTYLQIKDVFIASGVEYKESDILACNPDSQEQVNEQIAYYRE